MSASKTNKTGGQARPWCLVFSNGRISYAGSERYISEQNAEKALAKKYPTGRTPFTREDVRVGNIHEF